MENDEAFPSETKMERPNILHYMDYRAFMRDQFRWLHANDVSFSQRKMARLGGISNPGYFNEVIQGRRRLSSAAIAKMGLGMGLESNETEFLRVLVAYAESKDQADKDSAQLKLQQRRSRHFFRRLNQKQSKYYLDFNYPLVRAAIEACDFRGNFQMLGDFLRPQMLGATVKRYVRDLCEWGLVTQESTGKYVVTHSFIEPPDEMRDALVKLQQAWLTQSVPHIDSVPASERHVSSALVTVSEESYRSILLHVEKMREEIIEIVRADKAADRVILFNIQILPRGGAKMLRTVKPVKLDSIHAY